MVTKFITQDKVYYYGFQVAKLLGYKSPSSAIYDNVLEQNKMTLGNLKKQYGDFETKHLNNIIVIDETGVKQLILKSRMPKALDLAKKWNIDVQNIKMASKEQTTVQSIMKAFEGKKMIFQFSVDKYRIDLYFPKYKLAIECDEFGHLDRNTTDEHVRQLFLEETLGCKFIRYNPDDPTFDIFTVINKILLHMESHKVA